MTLIDHLFKRAREMDASDLHLQAGLPPRLRVGGELCELETEPALTPAQLEERVLPLLTQEQLARLEADGFVDSSLVDPEQCTWRCHTFRQRTGLAAAFRRLIPGVPSLSELNLPRQVGRLAHLRAGLVLITGPTGSGKTTTLAGLIGEINRTHRRHIITIERPIEYVFTDERSVIQQRAVHEHVASFGRGVQDALSERPDVLVVGEMVDYEAVRAALTAAETGVLVLGTLHSNDAAQTIDRLLDLFDVDEQPLARALLSQSLQAVISQVLLHRPEGKGRIPACELMLRTPALPTLVREGRLHELASMIQTHRAEGMRLLDDALLQLVLTGEVEPEEALRYARRPDRFTARLARERPAHHPGGMPRGRERRHEARVKTLNLVSLSEFNNVGVTTELTPGRTLDLSHDGVRIEVNHPVLIGSYVRLTLALEERLIEIRGEVRSLEKLGEHDFAVGLRFVDVAEEDAVELDDFLRMHA